MALFSIMFAHTLHTHNQLSSSSDQRVKNCTVNGGRGTGFAKGGGGNAEYIFFVATISIALKGLSSARIKQTKKRCHDLTQEDVCMDGVVLCCPSQFHLLPAQQPRGQMSSFLCHVD